MPRHRQLCFLSHTRDLFAALAACAVFVALSLASAPASAAGEGLDLLGSVPSTPGLDVVGIRPMGMGNAGLALADGPEGFNINPAGISRFNGSFVEAGFFFHPAADNRVFNASIADARSDAVLAGGASYSYYVAPRTDDGKYYTAEGHIVRLGTAVRWNNTLYVGVSVKYIYLNRPFHPVLSVPQLDVGVTWQINSLISISAVGYNLIYNDSMETPISAGLGVALGYKLPFRLTVDWIMDFQSRTRLLREAELDPAKRNAIGLEVGHELRIGAEYVIAKIVSIRAGYHFDHARNSGHHLGLGVGFRYGRFGAEIAYRQQLALERQGENRLLAISARLYF